MLENPEEISPRYLTVVSPEQINVKNLSSGHLPYLKGQHRESSFLLDVGKIKRDCI